MISRCAVVATAAITTGLTASLLAGPRNAVAAPVAKSSVDATIAQLQANGSRVILSKIGTGPIEDCAVTSVRPIRTTVQTPIPQVRGPNMVTVNTVHVAVIC